MSEPLDLKKLLALIGAGTDPKALEDARKQLIASQPVDTQLINDTNKSIQDLRDAYTLANSVLSGAGDIDPADPVKSKGFVPTLIAEGVTVYVKPGGKTASDVYAIDSVNRKAVETALQGQLKAYSLQIATLEGVVKQAQNAPLANADATLKGLQSVLLTTGVNDLARTQRLEDEQHARDLRLQDAAAAATAAGKVAQEGTVATMIVQDPNDGQWYFRQILKNGKFTDSLYNPSDADRAKALYNAPDGSIGSLNPDGKSVTWTYRPPRLTKTGDFTYSTEFDSVKQDYVGAQTTISSPGQKLEMYNGQLYVTEIKDGKVVVTKVKDMPTMSEKDRQDLEIASRNAATAEKNQALAAAESGIKVDTAKFALDQAKEAKQIGSDIIAGQLTVIEGLIKSGTPADLAKAQELYQSARRDWEVEKKNATDRRDKAQDKGLRRSGMMFLRGATAVQGGKTGADAQKMYAEEYNRTPGREGETYSERMARSLGLGADLDQNLNTTFPTFSEYAKGVTASANAANANAAAAAAARSPVVKPNVPAVLAGTANATMLQQLGGGLNKALPPLAGPYVKPPVFAPTGDGTVPEVLRSPIRVLPTVANDGSGLAPGTSNQIDPGRNDISPVASPTVTASPADSTPSNFQGGGQGYFSAPADNSPADNSTADNSPADNSPADNSPADNSPADDSPAADPPVERDTSEDDMNALIELTRQLNGYD